jgi:hypothetical protein
VPSNSNAPGPDPAGRESAERTTPSIAPEQSGESADWTFGRGGFAKLYGDRLAQSSLLDCDVATRWVFLFLLSQADDKGRFRCASVAGLARAAAVTLDQAEKAVRELEAPDPDSTTKDEEGRRIVRIDGGWRIVAYTKYREYKTARQLAEALKKKRQRDRRKVIRDNKKAGVGGHVPGRPGDVPGTSVQRTEGREQTSERNGNGTEDGGASLPEDVFDLPSFPSQDLVDRIRTTASELERRVPDVPAGEWIRRASSIPAGSGQPARSFSDPARKGISDSWRETTFRRLQEYLADAGRPVPL